jgi:hypothetical protein
MDIPFRSELERHHRTNMDTQLSKNRQPVLCRPSPITSDGFGRTGRTNHMQGTPKAAFFVEG